jgi:hypothetical protein
VANWIDCHIKIKVDVAPQGEVSKCALTKEAKEKACILLAAARVIGQMMPNGKW